MKEKLLATLASVTRLAKIITPWRTQGLYFAWTATCFLIFLVATFPHRAFLANILAQRLGPQAALALDQVQFSLPFGYSIRKASLTISPYHTPPLLEADNVSLAPAWSALLRLRLTPITIKAEVAGGTVEALLSVNRSRSSARITISNYDLAHWRGLEHWLAGAVAGKLDAILTLNAGQRGITASQGSVEISLADMHLDGVSLARVGGFKLPDLSFRSVTVHSTITNGRIQLRQATAQGKELSASAQGVIMLAEPLELSALNLSLRIKLAPSAPPVVTLLFNFLPAPADSQGATERTFKIFGTLAHPRVSST